MKASFSLFFVKFNFREAKSKLTNFTLVRKIFFLKNRLYFERGKKLAVGENFRKSFLTREVNTFPMVQSLGRTTRDGVFSTVRKYYERIGKPILHYLYTLLPVKAVICLIINVELKTIFDDFNRLYKYSLVSTTLCIP